MKRFLLILVLLCSAFMPALAQDDDDSPDLDNVREKMSEYIRQKLKMNEQEAKKFSPVFTQYFKEWRSTIRENRADRLILRQKVAELQIKYRSKFRDILGDQRGNTVYTHQRNFINELREIRKESRRGGRRN